MSKHRLKVTLTDQPEPGAAVSACTVRIRSRIARRPLGNPQQLTVLVPGNQVRSAKNHPSRRRPHGAGSRCRCYPEWWFCRVNVTEANRYVPVLNRIADGARCWLLRSKRPRGIRSKTTLECRSLAQSALEATAEEYQAAHQPPVPSPTLEVLPVSLEQACTVLARLSQAGHIAQFRELIHAAAASKLSEVEPYKFGQLLEPAGVFADA